MRASREPQPQPQPQPRRFIALLLVALLVASCSKPSALGHDARANPLALLDAAKTRAGAEGKLVLLISGGDWCSWCHSLSRFLSDNRHVSGLLEQTFVLTKVYIGQDNTNSEFFASLLVAEGTPHF